MESLSFDAYISVMNKINSVIGGKWKPGIIHLIGSEINRFGSISKHIPAISKKMLTKCLRDLESDTLIVRETVKANHPQIIVYQLSPSGASFKDLIDRFIVFGLEHFGKDFPSTEVERQLKQINALKEEKGRRQG